MPFLHPAPLLSFIAEWSPVLNALAHCATVAAAIWALQKYFNEQTWKRKEFVVKQYADFKADPDVVIAMTMLDWIERKIPLLPGKPPTQFDEEMIIASLMSQRLSNDGKTWFTSEEAKIRDVFSCFLDWLEQFHEFTEAGVLTMNDLRPYLGYWIDLIGNPNSGRLTPAVQQQLWQFLLDYKYTGVRELCRKYLHTTLCIDDGILRDNAALIARRKGRRREPKSSQKDLLIEKLNMQSVPVVLDCDGQLEP